MERIKWALYDIGALTLDMAYGIRSLASEILAEHSIGDIALMAIGALAAYACVFLALL